MKKNKLKKNILFVVIFISIFSLNFKNSFAETLKTKTSIPFLSLVPPQNETYKDNGLILLHIFNGAVNTTIESNISKNINLVNQDNQIVSAASTIVVGDTLDLEVGETYGSFYTPQGFGGAQFGEKTFFPWVWNTFPANNQRYVLITKIFTPVEDLQPTILSNNQSVINCTGLSCEAVSNGTAEITVSFPTKKYVSDPKIILGYNDPFAPYPSPLYSYQEYDMVTKGSSFYGTDVGFGKLQIIARGQRLPNVDTNNFKNMTYTFPPLTYRITVEGGALKPITACVSPTATQDSITINWTHTDNGAGPQSQYVVELASDASFSNIVDGGTGTTNTSHTFTGLTANTTYHARVQTKGNNEMSAWSNCGAITTTEDTQPGTFTVRCDADPGSLTIASGQSSAGPTTFRATASNGTIATYEWNKAGSIVSTNSTYTINSINAIGANSFSVPITLNVIADDGQTDSDVCSVNITDQNQGGCVGTNCGVGGTTPTTNFYFRPDITNGATCPLYLTASNVVSCELRNRNAIPAAYTYTHQTGNTISITGTRSVTKGQYRLWCTGTAPGAIAQEFGAPQTCSSNFDIKED